MLSEKEARSLACDIANRHLAGKTFPRLGGGEFTPPPIEPGFWLVVQHRAGRWHLSHDPPAGFFMAVSFADDGSDPQVERVGYADF